jgi:biopolymer transport protein TolR
MSDIYVTPMVDVMLVLLIIFMVAAPLLTVGVPIDLPKSQANNPLKADKPPLTISVKEDGKIFMGESELPLEELGPRLTAASKGDARTGFDEMIFVRGDKRAVYGALMKAMGKIAAAGFKHISLITESEQQQ